MTRLDLAFNDVFYLLCVTLALHQAHDGIQGGAHGVSVLFVHITVVAVRKNLTVKALDVVRVLVRASRQVGGGQHEAAVLVLVGMAGFAGDIDVELADITGLKDVGVQLTLVGLVVLIVLRQSHQIILILLRILVYFSRDIGLYRDASFQLRRKSIPLSVGIRIKLIYDLLHGMRVNPLLIVHHGNHLANIWIFFFFPSFLFSLIGL